MHSWCISLLLRWSIPSESSVFLRLHFCCMLNVTQITVLVLLPTFDIFRHSVNERMLFFFFTTFSTDQVFYTSMTVIGQFADNILAERVGQIFSHSGGLEERETRRSLKLPHRRHQVHALLLPREGQLWNYICMNLTHWNEGYRQDTLLYNFFVMNTQLFA